MSGAEYVFWICLFLIAHTYFVYPCALFLAYSLSQAASDLRYLIGRRDRRCSPRGADQLPGISMIIPAYNEQASLWKKIENLRRLDYPSERLQVLFISDGSTDDTNRILRSVRDPNIETIQLPVRKGKANALNHGVSSARHEILIFSDAATLFSEDAVKKLVRHFADPAVGVVCGALRWEGGSEYRGTEGVYWSYEGMLRLMEGRLGATLTASGAIYALRRRCYRMLRPDDLIEDFLIPMHARRLGYRVVYDPEAVGIDVAASSVKGEFTRRVRLATGSFNALGELLRIRLDFFTWVAFVSHKLLRWVLPFLMIGLLVSSGLQWAEPFYRAVFIAQLLFYIWAALGFAFHDRMQRVRYGLLGYFLVAINAAFLLGFIRFVTGRQETAWQRVH